MGEASLSTVFRELRSLRSEVMAVRYALIPTIRLSGKELGELRKIRKDMEAGKEKSFGQILKEQKS